jgi:predicted MFS family arabinose efflux permease
VTGSARRSRYGVLTTVFCTSAATIGQLLVVGKRVYDLTGSKLDLGLLGLAQFAPALLLVLVTGAVADRFERRHVVALGATLQGVVALGLGAYVGRTSASVLPIYALVVLFGIGQAFLAPAQRSLPADLVSADELPGLTARSAAAGQAGTVAGPVLGGFLYVAGVRLPFIAFAALSAVAAVSVLVVRPVRHAARRDPSALSTSEVATGAAVEAAIEPVIGHGMAADPAQGGLHAAFEGLRFVRAQPIVLGAISLDLFAVLFGGAVALLPAIAKDRLGVGAVGLGWLQAAAGIGAGLMTLVLAARPLRRGIGRTLLVVVAVFGVWTVVLGSTRTYALAFIAVLILSAADAISVYIRATLVPLITPDEMRGRVLAVENVFIGASNELGGFESGVTAQLIGTSGSVVLGGAATVIVAGLWAVLFPDLRRVQGFPGPAER